MKTNAIEVRGLTKKFKDFTAVKTVSFDIDKGEIFGLLGPNGAGKTTLISTLATLLRPTTGTASINGHDIVKEAGKVRASIGLVFQETILDLDLTAQDNLDFHASIYHLPKIVRQKRIAEVLALVGLSQHARKKVETFSGGMKRRLETARGLLHHPAILFLDEPTLGLDPQTRHSIWEYIKGLKEREHMTVLLTTHYMEEADFLCDRIAIIDNGKIIVSGIPSELKQKLRGDAILIAVDKVTAALQKSLRRISGVMKATAEGNEIRMVTSNAESKLQAIIEAVRKSGSHITAISIHKPTLEDVFLHYTGREIRDDK